MSRSAHLLKQLCLSVYTQAMKPNNFNNNAKTLTGFGPASCADRYLKSVDAKVVRQAHHFRNNIQHLSCLQDQVNHVYKNMFCPPFVLAPASQRSKKNGDSDTERSTVSHHLISLRILEK